ncbi:MAG: hypothetical protein QOI63_948 [Thermoplasmata archaeon]|jgi:hypothetical protein|nr:hypothetical protein [Thermoplasmata archaeon]
MQDTLHAFPPAGRLRPLPHVVETAPRASRAGALREAHASLQAAEANLLHLAAPHAAPRPGTRPPLFRRAR